MAFTSYPVNAPEAVKLWSETLFEEALKATWFDKFIGDSDSSIIQRKSNFKKNAGDRLTVTLRMQLTGDGVLGDATLEGNEEALTTYTDNLLIDQLRHAVRSGGKMTEQRIPWSIRTEAKDGLADWWTNRFDTIMFNQLAGVTYVTDARYTGNNAIIAPASTRIYRPNARANDQSLVAGDEMNLALIDQLVAQAKLATPVFRPIMWKGKKYYALVLHTNQVTQLRTATGTGQWLDIQKAAMTGGLIDDNPIFTGALGVYNGVVLFEDTRVPLGVNSATGAAQANTRRAVFLGAQAGILGFGKGMGESSMDWNEELFDYGNQLGVSAGSIFGFKKTVFNSVDFSTYVLATYTA